MTKDQATHIDNINRAFKSLTDLDITEGEYIHLKESADFAIHAINCHDNLVEALKEADAVLTNQDGRVKEIIKQALSKAESEPIK